MSFEGAGRAAGVSIWRIESFEAKPYDPQAYGKFYTGDCYIVLHSVQTPGPLEHTLYFWLGSESSQDEQGSAALLAVELDDKLGGAAVQVREQGEFESAGFLGLFKSIQFLKGGVKSGFNHVDRDEHDTRLFRLKGARVVTMVQTDVAAKSLNSGDVFVLDLKDVIYQWNGASANQREKSKGVDVCLSLRDEEHGGKARIEVLDEGSESAAFWAGLGGKGPVAAAQQDDQGIKAMQPKVLRCSDNTGNLTVSEVSYSGLLPSKSILTSSEVYFVDVGAEIYCWVGREASAAEKGAAMSSIAGYLQKNGRSKVVAVKVLEGAEPVAFKHKFTDFFPPPTPPTFGDFGRRSGSVAEAPPQQSNSKIAADMKVRGTEGEKKQAYDDGNGKATVYRIVDFEKERVPDEEFGLLYEGDSYIVHYVYEQNGKPTHLLYFWQGRESSQDEKGSSALLAKQIDDELGGAATQLRLEQGHETEHFLRLFKGRLVVRHGGHASGFRTKSVEEASEDDGVQLYQVKGYGALSTHGAQVEDKAASLNSGDCFVLITPASASIWQGSGSNAAERQVAASVASALAAGRPLVTLEEGEEPESFWEALGGKADYPKEKQTMGGEAPPRLFECSNRTGAFVATELFGWSQGDLLPTECFLLDTVSSLFVWNGGEANETEKRGVATLAKEYLEAVGRPSCPVITVAGGLEPALFASHFLGWDFDAPPAFVDPYEAKLALLAQANVGMGGEEAETETRDSGAPAYRAQCVQILK